MIKWIKSRSLSTVSGNFDQLADMEMAKELFEVWDESGKGIILTK
jgi:hypothetical protein